MNWMLATTLVLGVSLPGTAASPAARTPEPPAPRGFSSTEEVKEAIRQGKVRVADLLAPVPEDVVAHGNLEYARVADKSLQLDLYQPEGLRKPVPAIILIHGGGWKSGNRSIYRYYCVKLAQLGYVTATMSYRLSREAPYPAAVQDVKAAVRWLRANAGKYQVDPGNIALLGGSAGGHLAMMVGYTPGDKLLEGDPNPGVSSRVQAVVNFYGPTDLTAEEARKAGVVVDFLGGKQYDEAPDLYRQASPITHVTRSAPPTLILHGTIDETVPVKQADLLARRLKELGVPFEYERLAGWPHTMDLAEDVNRRCLWRVERFLARYMPVPAGAVVPATATAAE
jgi:acetyl esterase/lipase